MKASIQPAAIAGRSKGNITAVALPMLPAVASDRYRSRRAAREQRKNLAMIRQQAPLISEAAQRWWNVTTVADQSNSSASRAAKDAAAARARRTMMPLGISLHRPAGVHRPGLPAPKVQFTPPTEAKPEPQQGPGPADNQHNGGSVGGENRAQPIGRQILPTRVD